ncbi:MAG: M14 family metallopeptidase [Pseudomonadota bacterium]
MNKFIFFLIFILLITTSLFTKPLRFYEKFVDITYDTSSLFSILDLKDKDGNGLIDKNSKDVYNYSFDINSDGIVSELEAKIYLRWMDIPYLIQKQFPIHVNELAQINILFQEAFKKAGSIENITKRDLEIIRLLNLIIDTKLFELNVEVLSEVTDNQEVRNLIFESQRLKYFNETYEQSREEFVELGNLLIQSQSIEGSYQGEINVACTTDDDLTFNYVYIPALEKEKNLIIVSSGVHGIEGHVGSALQRFYMNKLIAEYDLDNSQLGFLFIHSVNPWGYKYSRRASENNVDMNRNFDISHELFEIQNEGYDLVTGLLNPEHKYNAKDPFFMTALLNILKYGKPALTQAIAQGQYVHSKGVFFGGKDFESQNKDVEQILLNILPSYEKVMVLDIHTAYGERGKLHMIAMPSRDEELELIRDYIFQDVPIDKPYLDPEFYTIHGGFADFVTKLCHDEVQSCMQMALEFGTLDSQTTTGAIETVRRFVAENQGYHNGYKGKADEIKVKDDFREMFYPSDRQWRLKALDQGENVIDSVINRMSE